MAETYEQVTAPVMLDETGLKMVEQQKAENTKRDLTNELLQKIFDAINGTTEIQRLAEQMKQTIDNYQVDLQSVMFKNLFLGDHVTAEQFEAIKKGDFSKLPLGGYWTINGITWRIVHHNYGFNRGDTAFTTNALVIMPDQNILAADGSSTHYWNKTDTTAGGYIGSEYRKTFRPQAKDKVAAAFGAAHIGVHRELGCNAVTDGKASAWAWFDADVELPTEAQIYGASVWGASTISGNGHNVGSCWGQFELFAVMPKFVVTRNHYWLRDVVSASRAAAVYYDGLADCNSASYAWFGVRPYFYLVG